MKGKAVTKGKSVFWSRLLGLLIAFAIVAVMVVGGVKNLMGELSAVHEALAASQREHAVSQNELAQTQAALQDETLALQLSAQQLDTANSKIRALKNERDHVKDRWGKSLRVLQQRNQQLVLTDRELRAAQEELERLQQQPQLSMIVTTERQFQMSQRERFAASHTRMAVSSDAGAMFYEGKQALYEKEEYVSYSERTQVLITQTAPGQDVLECLNDANKRRRRRGTCGTIVAVQASAMSLETYAYQSQYSGMQMLWME